MKVKEIAFVVYSVDDLKKARTFYEGDLGLKQENFWGDDAKGMIEYGFGPHNEYTVAIGCGVSEFKPGQNGGTAALEVDDFDAAIKKLKASKRKFLIEPTESPVCRMAVVIDPAGNSVLIHQRKAK